jgi:hypothetical protein
MAKKLLKIMKGTGTAKKGSSANFMYLFQSMTMKYIRGEGAMIW